MPNKEIPVKTREQIANEYTTEQSKVSVKMLNGQIEKYEIPVKAQLNFFPKQQKHIYEVLGYPPSVDKDLYKDV